MTDLAAIQAILKIPDREIWLVTAQDQSRRGALVATSVASVSLDPDQPCLLLALNRTHYTTELIQSSRVAGMHLLLEEHAELALQAALHSGRDKDKLDGIELLPGPRAAPILAHCLAWLECSVAAEFDAGERILFWLHPTQGGIASTGTLLTERQLIRQATPEQLARLGNLRKADWEKYRNALGERGV